MNRDKLFGGTDAVQLRGAAFRVIDRTQDEPEVQLKAIGLAFVCACEGTGVDPREFFESCQRMKNIQEGPYVSTYAAIVRYSKDLMGR